MFQIAIILMLLLASCGGSKARFVFDENAKNLFAPLPGKIGITLKTTSSEWHAIIQQGTLNETDSLSKPPKEAYAVGIGSLVGATGLPQQEGYEYRGPYVVSPDKRFTAASVMPKGSSGAGPTTLMIVGSKGRILAKVEDKEDRLIEGLAWSPDSKWLAILRSSYRKGRWPWELLAEQLGHAVLYMTYYLDVVDVDGNVIASTKLISDLRMSWGEIVWIE